MMLRFAEELMLLLLHDDGKFISVHSWSLNHALAGAVLIDLEMEGRIDTDLEKLMLVDATPVGDSLLDPTLVQIAAEEQHDARYWVGHIADESKSIHDEALERLIDRGILERRDDSFLWVLKSRRYPVVDGTATREVKLRIMSLLFSEDIPDPRDVVIIALADACQIFRHLLSRRELEQVQPRIEQIRDFDLIGRAVSQAIRDIAIWLARSQNYMI